MLEPWMVCRSWTAMKHNRHSHGPALRIVALTWRKKMKIAEDTLIQTEVCIWWNDLHNLPSLTDVTNKIDECLEGSRDVDFDANRSSRRNSESASIASPSAQCATAHAYFTYASAVRLWESRGLGRSKRFVDCHPIQRGTLTSDWLNESVTRIGI